MTSRFPDFSLTRTGSTVSDLLARFGQWWLSEFLQLFPERLSEWLTDRGHKKLTVSAEPDCVVLRLLSDSRRPLASVRIVRSLYTAASIDDFLKAHHLDRKRVALGIALPRHEIFSRRLILPVETAGSVGEIVGRDLVAKTPFRLEDIYHDHESRRIDGKVVVWQWVVRREFVAAAARSAGERLTDLAFVESKAHDPEGAPAPMLTLRQDHNRRQTRLRKAYYGLSLFALLLVAVTCTCRYWRQLQILDHLRAELTVARNQAQQVRAAMDKLDHKHASIVYLRQQKRDIPGMLDVWEEISSILPDSCWLTELRLSEIAQKPGYVVVMTGFSTAAADLVALVDKSPLFADATLTAPIALDPTEQRERFTLQARVQQKARDGRPAP